MAISDSSGRFLSGGRENAANGVVVLLHGVGMNAGFWRAMMRQLARHFYVIAPALYQSKSGKANKAPSLDGYAEEVAALLRARKIRRALLVGHSLGAHTALQLAKMHPQLALGVVALGAVYHRTAAAQKAVCRRAQLLQKGGRDMLINKTLARWREDNSPADSSAQKLARRMLQSANDKDYANAYGVFAKCDDVDMRQIDAPILFAAGGEDTNATPLMAKRLAAAAKNGCHYIVARRRHLFPLTAGGEVCKLIKAFHGEVCRGAHFGGGLFVGKNKRADINNNDNALRRAFGSFITGVTVVAAFDGNHKPRGFTANSFASVSMHPPLVSVCLAKGAGSYEVFRAADYFSVNILGEKQRTVATRFATRREDKFDGIRWKEQTGAPKLGGVAAWFGCAAKRKIPCGDHCILIGEVREFVASAAAPLGYLRGGYIRPELERRAQEAAATASGGSIIGVIIEKEESVYLQQSGGGWTLPFASGGKLRAALRQCGLECDFGFLYSVYARASGGQAVVYRANFKSGAPMRGAFFPLDALPPINDSAVRVLLRRFAKERQSGGHAVYVGDERAGAIHHLRA